MRRADRLFQLVQYLRGRRLTTAAQLAERLEVSIRTIYRDIRDLSLAGVPIEGEAGVGYRLRHDYELPPLSFDAIELEALALGARLAQSWAGPQLARAAELALAKIAQAMPTDKRIAMERSPLFAPRFGEQGHDAMIDRLRAAIDAHRRSGGMVVASTNVPLSINNAATIDLAAHAPDFIPLWGDDVPQNTHIGSQGDAP